MLSYIINVIILLTIVDICNSLEVTYDSNKCRQYCVVNNNTVSRQHWNYSEVTLHYGNPRDYRLYRRVGKGAYGEVYLGYSVSLNKDIIIKIYKVDRMDIAALNKEIAILQSLCGSDHIVQLYDIVPDDFQHFPTIVFEFVNTTYYKDLYPLFTPSDVKIYARQLLQALAFAHKRGVMHIDLKPANIVIDHASRVLKIIDWGLARFYYADDIQSKAGTYQYWSPELLVGYQHFDYSVDMWAFGCILATWLFRRRAPFFLGGRGKDQLREIGKILGNDDLAQYVRDMGLSFDVNKHMKEHYQRQSLKKFIYGRNREFATPLALDLLNKVLVYDPRKRLTAEQALQHPYFQEL